MKKRKFLQNLFSLLALGSFFSIILSAAALESEVVEIGGFCLWAGISLAVMGCSAYILNICYKEEER